MLLKSSSTCDIQLGRTGLLCREDSQQEKEPGLEHFPGYSCLLCSQFSSCSGTILNWETGSHGWSVGLLWQPGCMLQARVGPCQPGWILDHARVLEVELTLLSEVPGLSSVTKTLSVTMAARQLHYVVHMRISPMALGYPKNIPLDM